MPVTNLSQNQYSYNTILTLEARKGNIGHVMQVKAAMDADGMPSNIYTDSAVITCHGRMGNAPTAVGILLACHARLMEEVTKNGSELSTRCCVAELTDPHGLQNQPKKSFKVGT
jgi:hypothetical protein